MSMTGAKQLTSPNFGVPKESQHSLLQDVTRAHVDSFNTFLRSGLEKMVMHMDPVEFLLGEEDQQNRLRFSLKITKVSIVPPTISSANRLAVNAKVYPAECRERQVTYQGEIQVLISYTCSNGKSGVLDRTVGQMPIMVKSTACNIANLKPKELVARGEEAEEMGGYFIINGNEKVIRLLIQQRRNYPMCFCRGSWKNRGPEYTEYGVSIRCVREDQTSNNLTLHYLQNGTAKLSFGLNKEVFFIPVILVLKGLIDSTDKFIYDHLMRGREKDSYFKGRVVYMLRQVLSENLFSQASVLRYIGQKFRVKMSLPDWYSNEEVGRTLFKQSLCIHLKNDDDKFNLIVYMTQKLFAFVNGECVAENPDNPMFQELLLPGQLMQMLLKEKLELYLIGMKTSMLRFVRKKGQAFQISPTEVKTATKSVSTITRAMEYLLSTGNLISRNGLGLMQTRGFAVIADKLNFFRYVSHFRAVHRGSFFTEMRTTSVRKLLPEAWGFLCPVHTPDGAPCGLLNHMTASCKVVCTELPAERLGIVLAEIGMAPYTAPNPVPMDDRYMVILDGRIMGYVNAWDVETYVNTLRLLKLKSKGEVPYLLEICFVKKTGVASQYPGVYLFTNVSRMVRPVRNIRHNVIEMIGTFEQVYLDIAINRSEEHPGLTSHVELNPQCMLSIIANMTPYSDCNQSPRNMYQCQE